jgi:PAS domain-containing protein
MWNSRVPVLVFDSESRHIVGLNDAAASLFRTTSEALIGQIVDLSVVPEERERLAASVSAPDPRWGEAGPWQCHARDGSRFVAFVRFHQAIQEGRVVHIVLATEVVQVETTRSAAAGFGDPLRKTG